MSSSSMEGRRPLEPSLYRDSGLGRGLRTLVNAEAALILFQVIFCAQLFGSSLLLLALAPFGLGAWALVWLSRSVEAGDPAKCTVYLVWKAFCVLIYGLSALIFTGVLIHGLVVYSEEADQAVNSITGSPGGSSLHLSLFVIVLWALFGLGVWFLIFVFRVRLYLVRLSRCAVAAIEAPPPHASLAPPPPYPQAMKWETPPPSYDDALAASLAPAPHSETPPPPFPSDTNVTGLTNVTADSSVSSDPATPTPLLPAASTPPRQASTDRESPLPPLQPDSPAHSHTTNPTDTTNLTDTTNPSPSLISAVREHSQPPSV